jgi:hypothetical protein
MHADVGNRMCVCGHARARARPGEGAGVRQLWSMPCHALDQPAATVPRAPSRQADAPLAPAACAAALLWLRRCCQCGAGCRLPTARRVLVARPRLQLPSLLLLLLLLAWR